MRAIAAGRVDRAGWLIFAVALLPLADLVRRGFAGGLGANPIEAATHATGIWALRFLVVALAITPLARHIRLRGLLRYRRMIGLFALFYASLHMLLYFAVDHFFHWPTIVEDIVRRPFVTIGMGTFLILCVLGATSPSNMVRRLGGRRWRLLHRLVYVAGLGAALHFIIGTKADLREPMIYLALVVVLLALRLVPPLPRLLAARQP